MWQELGGQGQSQQGPLLHLKWPKKKNHKPHAHLHIIRKQSTKFQINPTKDVGGAAGQEFGQTEGLTDGRKDGRMHIQ